MSFQNKIVFFSSEMNNGKKSNIDVDYHLETRNYKNLKSFHKSIQYLCKKEKASPNATTSKEHAFFV